MARITVQFTQQALDAWLALRAQYGNTSLGQQANLFAVLDAAFAQAHPTPARVVQSGDTLRAYYPDGATTTWFDVTAGTGSFTASRIDDYAPDQVRMAAYGNFTVNYSGATPASATAFSAAAAQVLGVSARSLLTPGSAQYNSILGNSVNSAQGDVQVGADGTFSGTLSTLETHAERLILSAVVHGDFRVAGTASLNGQGSPSTTLAGTLYQFAHYFDDGSTFSLRGAELAVTGATVLNEALLGQAANFPGADVFDIALPARLDAPWLFASGAGDDVISLAGGGASALLDAGSGDDVIRLVDFGHSVEGGAGIDTAIFDGAAADFVVTSSNGVITVTPAAGGAADTLQNVERLRFIDSSYGFDLDGPCGQAYSLYRAAFGRAADQAGLGFWIRMLEDGATVPTLAQAFMNAPEFQARYGNGLTDAELVAQLYANVLQRAPDPAGSAYWNDVLSTHAATRAEVMAAFSQSAENQSALAELVGNGFAFVPYAGSA